jgi:hypothetical protein
MMSTFRDLRLKWSDVAATAESRVVAMLTLAGIPDLTNETAVELVRTKGEALRLHCAALEAEHNVADLRQLLLVLLDLGLEICDKENWPECNGRYVRGADLKRERRWVKGNKQISWTDSVPFLADFLYPAGTVLESYTRLYPGVTNMSSYHKFNDAVIHVLNPQSQRLAKASMRNCLVAGLRIATHGAELTLDDNGQADEAPAVKFKFMHCPCGKPYGADVNTTCDHYVPMSLVGNIDNETGPELASKWTKSALNLHREGERYALSPASLQLTLLLPCLAPTGPPTYSLAHTLTQPPPLAHTPTHPPQTWYPPKAIGN